MPGSMKLWFKTYLPMRVVLVHQDGNRNNNPQNNNQNN
jgi:hypothetical protein